MSTPNTPQLPAYVRTYVPLVVSVVGSELAKHGFNVDDELLQLAVGAGIGAVYYAVVRFLEKHQAAFGWLLGIAKQPVYVPGGAPAPDTGEEAIAVVAGDAPGEGEAGEDVTLDDIPQDLPE